MTYRGDEARRKVGLTVNDSSVTVPLSGVPRPLLLPAGMSTWVGGRTVCTQGGLGGVHIGYCAGYMGYLRDIYHLLTSQVPSCFSLPGTPPASASQDPQDCQKRLKTSPQDCQKRLKPPLRTGKRPLTSSQDRQEASNLIPNSRKEAKTSSRTAEKRLKTALRTVIPAARV